ncbi:MAG TPA: PTS fructose transporter subunit IIA [Anaeromyxobacteraceae bacterium]|nr:PTS fructose transporter subunit IIA [Anaeromyxobacteraceae bacterium]
MVGVVVATHGRLAAELVACAEAIVGKMPRVQAVSVSAEVPMDAARDALALAIREVDEGDGVLVLTDMLGGTPANLALGFLEGRVDVVTGANLPMLLKLSTCRAARTPLEEIARLITAYGQKNITLASELLRARARGGPETP